MNVQPKYLVDVMSKRQKFFYGFLVMVWLVNLIWFWGWWLQSNHVVTYLGLIITSYVAAYQTIVPIWFFWFAAKAKKPNTALPLPEGRVAMMTTKVPSEPWDMVKHTLKCMLAQNYPNKFDVWLADEDPTPEVLAWCRANGVGVTSRKGMPEFNKKSYPGQAKTKEGNTLSWYVMVGYDNYDFVVQMDSDHAPGKADYLRHMIAPFINPKVGMVAAPSMNDSNMNESWAARGRVFVETNVHGLMQAGYSSWGCAMGIGSHYAVRTKALKEAGGPGPTRAEDAGTTLLMSAAGYDSVFAIDAVAHGEGPGSFGVAVTQELDWSISLVRLWIDWLPSVWKKLPLKKKTIFTFSFGWYPLFASSMTLGAVLPVVALITKAPWMNMNYLDFLWRWWLFVVATILPIWFIKANGWFRPKESPLISWEALVFHAVRWPWALAGVISGVISSIFKSGYTFHITPKGKDKERPLGVVSILPYVILILMSGIATLAVKDAGYAEGYRFLAFLDIVLYTLILSIVVILHITEVPDRRSKVSGVPGLVSSVLGMFIVFTSTLTILPKANMVFAAVEATPTSADVYVGVRTQLGPTPQPPTPPSVIENMVAAILPTHTPEPVVPLPREMMVGMFDPAHQFDDFGFNLRHQFTDWNYPEQMDRAIVEAQSFNQFPMITVEPRVKEGLQPNDLLRDVASGAYDEQILQMAEVLNKYPSQKVIIRWAHEMDLCKVYDWATCNVPEFKAAYTHVVDLIRAEGATNALWIWSPAGGNPNTSMFYPGDSYVDYIGITALSSEDWDNFYGYPTAPRSLETILNERYGIAEEFNKPLIVAELGISYHDPTLDRTKWLSDAFAAIKSGKYPLIAGWVYFNNLNNPNPHITILPDFRISWDEMFNSLLSVGGFGSESTGQETPGGINAEP